MALCADKAKPVQVKAEEASIGLPACAMASHPHLACPSAPPAAGVPSSSQAGEAFMACLNPAAVDAMLLLLFKQFEEHRWQTKLAAVKMFSALAKSSTNAVVANLPEVVRKLMEVSQAGRSHTVSFPEVPFPRCHGPPLEGLKSSRAGQVQRRRSRPNGGWEVRDGVGIGRRVFSAGAPAFAVVVVGRQDPKALIKETAIVALTSCCSVIDNPDVVPHIDAVISANVNPDTEGEACLDRLVATTCAVEH